MVRISFIDTSDGPSPQKKERLQRSLDRKEKRQQHIETEKKQQEQETLLLEQKEVNVDCSSRSSQTSGELDKIRCSSGLKLTQLVTI